MDVPQFHWGVCVWVSGSSGGFIRGSVWVSTRGPEGVFCGWKSVNELEIDRFLTGDPGVVFLWLQSGL